ncbi:heavy metal translocating P-type ATPase, partial [Klebsiella pneumoniae]|nr:heavy metal translocating P-type ATPase [Klebsiella pneumoniae]
VRTLPPFEEVEALGLAASLEQASGHPMARALVSEARGRGLALSRPEAVAEIPGAGVAGIVAGRRVVVGGPRLLREHAGA